MKRELAALLGEREIAVAVEQAGGAWRVAVDGRDAVAVDAVEIHPGTWSIIADGVSLLIDVDRRGARTTLLAGGEEVTFDLVDARRHRLAQAVAQSGRGVARGEVVRAPIAGKVVKVLVTAGQEVAAGQGVAMLEAMKMENELKAERGGTVETVHVQPGQSVDSQAPLVTLK
jgi:biotin carboxyl carrier protein